MDATVAAVPGLGGTVTAAPEDAGPGGRTAACLDPAGAPFRLWQARRRLGAQLTNTPSAWNSSDLYTPDRAAAMAFYAPLFVGEPPHWHVTSTVADQDDSAATAERLGATVLRSTDGAWTRDALLRDPQGPSSPSASSPRRAATGSASRGRRRDAMTTLGACVDPRGGRGPPDDDEPPRRPEQSWR